MVGCLYGRQGASRSHGREEMVAIPANGRICLVMSKLLPTLGLDQIMVSLVNRISRSRRLRCARVRLRFEQENLGGLWLRCVVRAGTALKLKPTWTLTGIDESEASPTLSSRVG